jgi:hypothetical protein
MTTLTKLQVKNFLDENINDSNFFVFSKLLYLENIENLTFIIEKLYSHSISIFDLVNLPDINDLEINTFIINYKNKYENASNYFYNPTSFNALLYLETGGYINNLVVSYNQFLNANIKFNSERYVKRIVLNDNSFNTFKTELEVKNFFNTEILPDILTEFSVSNIDLLFPVPSFTNADTVSKYNSIFSPILDRLNNTNFYKFLISINYDNLSYSDLFSFIISNVMNFDSRNTNATNYKNQQLHTLANLGRGYNFAENEQFIENYQNQLFNINYNDAFGYILINYYMSCIYNTINSNPIDNTYLSELNYIKGKIDSLKQLISFSFDKINSKM